MLCPRPRDQYLEVGDAQDCVWFRRIGERTDVGSVVGGARAWGDDNAVVVSRLQLLQQAFLILTVVAHYRRWTCGN